MIFVISIVFLEPPLEFIGNQIWEMENLEIVFLYWTNTMYMACSYLIWIAMAIWI